jgi:magnesium-transporting ATPase (P-type)
VQLVGNRTECGLLQLVSGLGADYAAVRAAADTLRVFPFSSERKRMSTLTRQPDARRAQLPLLLSPPLSLQGCQAVCQRITGYRASAHAAARRQARTQLPLLLLLSMSLQGSSCKGPDLWQNNVERVRGCSA